MVRPPAAEVAMLMQVAREVREMADADGYTVGLAVGQHEAFSDSRGPAGSMERALVLKAARNGAAAAGLSVEEVSGSLDIVAISATTIRRYRVRRVKLDSDGGYRVVCGAGSSLLSSEPDSFFREEKWILGFITSDEHTIDHLVAAEIVGWHGEGPFRLDLGMIIDLSAIQPPPNFTSTDEGLDLGDEGDIGETGDASGL